MKPVNIIQTVPFDVAGTGDTARAAPTTRVAAALLATTAAFLAAVFLAGGLADAALARRSARRVWQMEHWHLLIEARVVVASAVAPTSGVVDDPAVAPTSGVVDDPAVVHSKSISLPPSSSKSCFR